MRLRVAKKVRKRVTQAVDALNWAGNVPGGFPTMLIAGGWAQWAGYKQSTCDRAQAIHWRWRRNR